MQSPCTRYVAFWLKPLSTFGLFKLTMFIESSPGLAMPFILAPFRLSADRCIVASRFQCRSYDRGYFVRRLGTVRYLTALLPGILPMERQVLSRLWAK
jgi:hypothetical protein